MNQMQFMDLVQSRHAFRKYDDQPLTSEELQPILLAAEASPVGFGKIQQSSADGGSRSQDAKAV